jgi:RNA polymerase-interacting CarD/CdnL/TRCF family regulator
MVAQQPQGGQWVPPYGQPIAGKTRAQVYQQLVHAEKDGQLSYLDKTLYAHH